MNPDIIDMKFTIGESVDELPFATLRKTHYAEMWDAINSARGKWVPITFESYGRANAFASACRKLQREEKIDAILRKNTVYARLRIKDQADAILPLARSRNKE